MFGARAEPEGLFAHPGLAIAIGQKPTFSGDRPFRIDSCPATLVAPAGSHRSSDEVMYHTATSSGDGSEPIDRRHAALGRHPIGRDDHNLAALILNELCGIVE